VGIIESYRRWHTVPVGLQTKNAHLSFCATNNGDSSLSMSKNYFVEKEERYEVRRRTATENVYMITATLNRIYPQHLKA